MDKEEAKSNLKNLPNDFNLPIMPISSNEKINLTKLLIYLRSVYDKLIK